MKQIRLARVILSPRITEKTTRLSDTHRQFAFKVLKDANKAEIKEAVEFLFNVKVNDIRVLNMPGKKRRFGQRIGQRQNWKKAYVSLQEGQDIKFVEQEV